jgi:hypothetical protein
VQVTVDSPDAIDVDVVNSNVSSVPDDLDPDDDGSQGTAVQTGEGTFVTNISASGGSGSATEGIGIYSELDDTAEPGSYDIGVAINPLSTDN